MVWEGKLTMARLKPGTPETIRNHNRYLALDAIERRGPVSRAELSRITQISEPTIYSIIDYFISKDIVAEVGMGQSTGGRKPILLKFNPEAGFVVGVALGGKSVKMSVSDLGKGLRHRHVIPMKHLGAKEAAIAGIAEAVRELIDESGIPQDKFLSVGVAVPGVVDPNTGEVSLAPQIGWDRIAIGQRLHRELGIPVSVERNVNAAALAETQWGIGRDGVDDFVFISISTGIGAAIVIGGELYGGHSNSAGEIGYMITDLGWLKRERPEGFGCLETFADTQGILRITAEKWSSSGREMSRVPQTVEEVFDLARAGDEVALAVIEKAADHLAAGIINISVLLNPQAVVIGGDIVGVGDLILNLVAERLERVSPIRPQLMLSKMQADTELIGAVSIACLAAKKNLLL
jgi:predicted NBD/HSP70 family sugar kinase